MQEHSFDYPPDYQTASEAAVYNDCNQLGMPTGIVSQIDDSAYRIVALKSPLKGIMPGMLFHLGETYCAEVIKNISTVIRPDVSAAPYSYKHPAYVGHALRCYIGAPILRQGHIVGTLNFTSEKPRSWFAPEEIKLVESLADMLSTRWVQVC